MPLLNKFRRRTVGSLGNQYGQGQMGPLRSQLMPAPTNLGTGADTSRQGMPMPGGMDSSGQGMMNQQVRGFGQEMNPMQPHPIDPTNPVQTPGLDSIMPIQNGLDPMNQKRRIF